MCGKVGKSKGGKLVVLSFGAGRLHTPSPTPHASSSVAGAQLAVRMSYNVLLRILRVGLVESEADIAVCSEGIERLQVSQGNKML